MRPVAISFTTLCVCLSENGIETLTSNISQNHDDSDAPTPPLAQLVDDGILAIVAGADTTASALASIFACILSSPSAYDALQAEVDRFYPKDADVFDITRQREMKYLNAVMYVPGFCNIARAK